MTKQITIEVSDENYKAYSNVVAEIIGAATYIEAVIEIQEV